MHFINKNNDFQKYALSEKGISSLKLHEYSNLMTPPYILEQRPLHAVSLDIFSRMMMDRIIWITTGFNSDMATIIQAQLMYLDELSNSDIRLHINSGGGSITSGLAIIDVMEYINSDVETINTELAASMGAVLLAAGTKGKRSSLRNSRTMIHQSSGGAVGEYDSAKIQFEEWSKLNKTIFEYLSNYTGKPSSRIVKDCVRDKWFSAEEALEYGLIDEIVKPNKNKVK